jgi:hypothetical protein
MRIESISFMPSDLPMVLHDITSTRMPQEAHESDILRDKLESLLLKAQYDDGNADIAYSYNPAAAALIANNIEGDTQNKGQLGCLAMYRLLSYEKTIELMNRDAEGFTHYLPNDDVNPHHTIPTVSALDAGIISHIANWYGYESVKRIEGEGDDEYTHRMLSSVFHKPHDMIDTIMSPVRNFVARCAVGYPYDYSRKIADSLYRSHNHGDNGALLFLHGHIFGYHPKSPMAIGSPQRMLRGFNSNGRHYSIGCAPLLGVEPLMMQLIDGQYNAHSN